MSKTPKTPPPVADGEKVTLAEANMRALRAALEDERPEAKVVLASVAQACALTRIANALEAAISRAGRPDIAVVPGFRH